MVIHHFASSLYNLELMFQIFFSLSESAGLRGALFVRVSILKCFSVIFFFTTAVLLDLGCLGPLLSSSSKFFFSEDINAAL